MIKRHTQTHEVEQRGILVELLNKEHDMIARGVCGEKGHSLFGH